jgi:hypothetical protein
VVQEPQREEAKTQKEVQPESTEAALEVNGMTQNPEEIVESNGSQTTISGKPIGEIAEDASA